MTPVKVCSICTGAIVGFGNDAQPTCHGSGEQGQEAEIRPVNDPAGNAA